MKTETSYNIRLGLFVIVGAVFLIAALYLIGEKQNLFGSTLSIQARFANVSGLTTGNNVRYNGIDIGTVEAVRIESDTCILVTMVLDKEAARFIHKNSIATVGTDGLMGNRLINISAVEGASTSVADGDCLVTRRPMETEEMMRTLNETNINMKLISENLLNITNEINSNKGLLEFFTDSSHLNNISATLSNLRKGSQSTAVFTQTLTSLAKDLRYQKGTLISVLTDTSKAGEVDGIIARIEHISDSVTLLTSGLSRVLNKIERGEGTAGMMLNDTSLAINIRSGINAIRLSAEKLNEDLEGLKHSFLLRRYFKKKNKRQVPEKDWHVSPKKGER